MRSARIPFIVPEKQISMSDADKKSGGSAMTVSRAIPQLEPTTFSLSQMSMSNPPGISCYAVNGKKSSEVFPYLST